MQNIVALFSGQGSQYPGMAKTLYEESAAVRALYECAADVLKMNVAALSFSGSEEELRRTGVAQPVIFTHSLAAFTMAKERLPAPTAVAGHSLGEYAALCCAGAFSQEDGFRIIGARAAAMERVAQTTGGAMVAVMGLDAHAIEAVCDADSGEVWAVNFNQPQQTVISGEAAACARVAETLAAQGAKTVPLSVAGAFHTPLMQAAADELKAAVQGIAFAPTTMDFYANLTGDKLNIDNYPDYFARHMLSPVRFTAQVAAMGRDGVDAVVEFGPGRTGIGLVRKNNRALRCANVDDMASLDKAAQTLARE